MSASSLRVGDGVIFGMEIGDPIVAGSSTSEVIQGQLLLTQPTAVFMSSALVFWTIMA